MPHGNTARHSVHCVLVCMLSNFSMQFTSVSRSADLQVPQIHTWIWGLVLRFFFTWSCWVFLCWSKKQFWYVVVASYCSQIIWIVHTMRDYGETYKSVSLMCDNSSALYLAQNPDFHGRAKHIKVRHHLLRDHVENRDTEVRWDREVVDWYFHQTPWCDLFCFFARGTWFFPSLWHGLSGSLCFILYILYLIFIALHFIHIYLIYFCLTYYGSLYLVDYACHCARVSRDEIWNSFMLDLAR
jgi:hypothetical protein